MATMAEAKRDFARGSISGATIQDGTMFDGPNHWVISIDYRWPVPCFEFLVDARTKGPRQFKTLDAAVSALRTIGFTPFQLKVS